MIPRVRQRSGGAGAKSGATAWGAAAAVVTVILVVTGSVLGAKGAATRETSDGHPYPKPSRTFTEKKTSSEPTRTPSAKHSLSGPSRRAVETDASSPSSGPPTVSQSAPSPTGQHSPSTHPQGTVALSGWSRAYQGLGAYSQQGARLKQNVQVANGVLTVFARPVTTKTVVGSKTLAPGDYAAGGIMNQTDLNPGSRISMDLRMDASVGTRAVALLWPSKAPWPEGGELDFDAPVVR